MPTISEKQKERIAKLMSDPRYWDKAHPEHAQVFADAQRAFQAAYPEAEPDKQTTSGTVHVRAYTRTQDGKEIQVSEYDRTQQIAFHPPELPDRAAPNYLQDVAEGPMHKREKARIVDTLRAYGNTVETEVTLVGLNGVPARVDVMGKSPEGHLFAIEIKTSAYKSFSPHQWMVYPLLDQDWHVFSTSPKIRSFGFAPGQLLPGICLYGALAGPNKLKNPIFPLTADPACRPPNYRGPVWNWKRGDWER